MKRIVQLSVVVIALLFLTGCLEIFQYVSMTDGRVNTTVRILIQKSIMEMGASFSDEEVDYDEMLGDIEEVREELGPGAAFAEISPLETELEIGYQLRFEGLIQDFTGEANGPVDYVPTPSEQGYRIVIPHLGDNAEGDSEGEYAMAFFAGSKYRIIVDRSGDLAEISDARLIDLDTEESVGDALNVEIFDDIMLVEIPMILIMTTPQDLTLELF